MLYKVALTFESVDEIQKCDHSNLGKLLSSRAVNFSIFCETIFGYVFLTV